MPVSIRHRGRRRRRPPNSSRPNSPSGHRSSAPPARTWTEHAARYRQQELLLLVAAAVARDEGARHRLRRDPHLALRSGIEGAHPAALAGGQGADPQGRRHPRVGFARDHRIPGRAQAAALADGPRRARPGSLDLGGDAFGLRATARAHEHERAQALSGQGAHARSREGHRPHQRDLGRCDRTFPLWRVHRGRRDVCPGGAALSHLRRRRAQSPIHGRDALDAGHARMDRGGRARAGVDPRARSLRVKTYVVGGAVRDELLGLPVKDRDHVVVGSTPEEMERLGYKPVGKDFPVFLHPQTHEEHALARTERKSGRGYKGFTVHAAPDVTLEDDLKRRDLTINAMAKAEDGSLIDPFRGKDDLQKRVLRHVSEAFAEDPVRILRVARFAARFGFEVAPETMALMKQMVSSGEADFLVAERVWQEFSKGLAEKHPERMFEVLEASGLRAKLLPELSQELPALKGSVPVRFALLAWPLTEAEVEALCERLRLPNDVRELALAASRNRSRLLAAATAPPGALLELLKRVDAFRRPERFAELLQVATAGGADARRLEKALRAAAGVDAGAVAARAQAAADIPALIDRARTEAMAKAL